VSNTRAARRRTEKIFATAGPNFKKEMQAAAFHEAAHVIADLHFGCPIGPRGVYLVPSNTGGFGVSGFSDALWTQMPQNPHTQYVFWVGGLIAPFGEYRQRDHPAAEGDGCSNEELAQLMIASISDFAPIFRLEVVQTGQHTAGMKPADMRVVENWQRLFFMLWLGQEPEGWEKQTDKETVTTVRDLVHDTDTMLMAYWKQIAALGNAILSAPEFRLSGDEVAAWQDQHFKKLDVTLAGLVRIAAAGRKRA
jgi:hypothetical protein